MTWFDLMVYYMEDIEVLDVFAYPFTKASAKDRVWNTSRGMGLKTIDS